MIQHAPACLALAPFARAILTLPIHPHPASLRPPPLPQVPHSLINGYKNVLAIAVETEYSFPQAEKVRAAASLAAVGGLPWEG